jgi:hypothetical protein
MINYQHNKIGLRRFHRSSILAICVTALLLLISIVPALGMQYHSTHNLQYVFDSNLPNTSAKNQKMKCGCIGPNCCCRKSQANHKDRCNDLVFNPSCGKNIKNLPLVMSIKWKISGYDQYDMRNSSCVPLFASRSIKWAIAAIDILHYCNRSIDHPPD